jgi:Ser/Thr protein kinase RdoA (MazF antagonist)
LGFVLWAAGARDLRLVDAFVSLYRRDVTFEAAELTALPTAIGARPLTMTCWSLAVGRSRGSTAASEVSANMEIARTSANRVRGALQTS